MNSIVLFIVGASLISASPVSITNDNLLSVVQLYRHGQRSPLVHYKNDPYTDDSYWPVGVGQLTNVGKLQHQDLGQYTRQRYDGWLPERYSPDDIFVQTSNVDRCHMSAQSDLLGLYPPKHDQIWNQTVPWQPIPVHISNASVVTPTTACDAYGDELDKVINYDPYYVDISKTYQDVFAYLTQHSGDDVYSIEDVWEIYDTLMIEEEFGYELPKWTAPVYPEPLKTITGYVFQAYAFNKKLARMGAGVFLNDVVKQFDAILAGPFTKKYQMYSAHDVNVALILGALGAFKPVPPYFASSVYIELRQRGVTPYINVYYKQKDVVEPIIVQGCQFDCSLRDFKRLLADVIVDTHTWTQECSSVGIISGVKQLTEKLFSQLSERI